ncbi:hypothetical protein RND81_04G054900 [Saponaria officinalis]|uniref:Uncharacterized protein n=1 Tax=Saponaria officinalis TaxID=3572 RepID=A0AAW1LHD9_SAPOF
MILLLLILMTHNNISSLLNLNTSTPAPNQKNMNRKHHIITSSLTSASIPSSSLALRDSHRLHLLWFLSKLDQHHPPFEHLPSSLRFLPL